MEIKDLIRYRKNGVTKLSACKEYDELKLRREKIKENRKKMDACNPRRTNASTKKDLKVEKKKEKKETPAPLFSEVINTCAGYELLSVREKQLCNSLEIKPAFYLTTKGIILKVGRNIEKSS